MSHMRPSYPVSFVATVPGAGLGSGSPAYENGTGGSVLVPSPGPFVEGAKGAGKKTSSGLPSSELLEAGVPCRLSLVVSGAQPGKGRGRVLTSDVAFGEPSGALTPGVGSGPGADCGLRFRCPVLALAREWESARALMPRLRSTLAQGPGPDPPHHSDKSTREKPVSPMGRHSLKPHTGGIRSTAKASQLSGEETILSSDQTDSPFANSHDFAYLHIPSYKVRIPVSAVATDSSRAGEQPVPALEIHENLPLTSRSIEHRNRWHGNVRPDNPTTPPGDGHPERRNSKNGKVTYQEGLYRRSRSSVSPRRQAVVTLQSFDGSRRAGGGVY
ncbi:hypothetical protein F4680DRAFT_442089 [Xylaria scruposa]|nr:hypothetical protein F4680DRAFT_442089 [Xylaria scruposa]